MDLISPFGTDSLDLDKIRESFKQYLIDNGVIKDVDYIGSNISILVDIIAYSIKNLNSTHALLANETMLKTSTIRQNIVFLASQLGYEITRRMSSKIQVKVSYDIPASSGISLTIPKFTKFQSGDYYFTNTEDILLDESNSTVIYDFKQGIGINGDYDSNLRTSLKKPVDKIVLNYQNIENNSIEVKIKRACNDGDYVLFKKATSLMDLEDGYYVEEYEPTTGYVVLYFYFSGYGKILDANDSIDISFVISDGAKTNGLSDFTLNDTLYDSLGNEVELTFEVLSSSYGGQDEETIESIKTNAPLFYNSANRGVSESDYRAIMEKSSLIKTAIAWGGELMLPQLLGTVMVSAIPEDEKSEYLSDLEIANLLESLSYVRIMSTYRNFYQPVYFKVDFAINILGNVKSISEKQILIENNLNEYFNTDLSKFGSVFYESKAIKTIESAFVEEDASVNIDYTIYLELKDKHFNYNIHDSKCCIFIPNSSKRYYLTKDGNRIDMPKDDMDLYTYLNNGWVKSYEPNENLDIVFDYFENGNILGTGNQYNDGTIDKKDILWNGNIVGYFDITNSILWFDETFKNEIGEGIDIRVTYNPYFNAVMKHNSILKLGAISYV